jgi:hypothetical protein
MQILCLITISITKGLTKMNKQYPSIIEPFITKTYFPRSKTATNYPDMISMSPFIHMNDGQAKRSNK